MFVVKAADHFHIGARVESVHRGLSLAAGEAVKHQLHDRRVVADDDAVKFPFVAEHLFQNKWICRRGYAVEIVKGRHK